MLLRLLLFVSILLANASAQAALPLLREMVVLEDPTGTETVWTIARRADADFRPVSDGVFAGGFTRSVHWFRFTVDAPAGEWWLELLPPVLDDLRLYEPAPSAPNGFVERRSGDMLSFTTRELDYRGFVFKLRHSDDTPRTYYLRLQTTSSSVFILRLWEPGNFYSRTSIETALLFSSVSIILVVTLLNINAWFWLRDPLTPWFIAYLMALAGHSFCVNGFLQQYLAHELPDGGYALVAIFSYGLIGTANGFYRRLFGVSRDRPVLYWLYEINTWLPLTGLLLSLQGYLIETMPHFLLASILMTLIGFGLSVGLGWRRAPGGMTMLLANVFALTGILVFVLNLRGFLAGGFAVWHSMQIASLGTILALQIAVGARYRALREERVRAERDAQQEREMRRQQGQFLAMLAHELRTALSVLKMAVGRQPMTPKAVASAERAMTGMGEVIERSIQAEKLADGTFQLECQPCDARELIESLVAATLVAEQFQIQAGEWPPLNTDPKLLRVILANLIDNAVKYAAPGTMIEIGMTSVDAGFGLRVVNIVGPAGRPDPEKVFHKYYRSPHAHELTGSGLGLYIAQGMAHRLGGTLTCQTGEGRVGFELRLPVAP